MSQATAPVATLRDSVATRNGAGWSDPWQLTRGDVVLRSMPRGLAPRVVAINHLVHHRGQLSVFLRLLDTPVPGLYGPSADER
ncbi:MAG TPA: DinB family protein [Gemmatimonadaceae bacterium]